MKTSHPLLVGLCLLSYFGEVLPSNPDSVRVQDSTDNSDDGSDQTTLSSAPLRISSESPQGSVASDVQTSSSLPNTPSVRPLGRKALPATSGFNRPRILGPFSMYISRMKEFRRTRPDFVVATHEVTRLLEEEAVTSKPRIKPDTKEPPSVVPGLNQETYDGEDSNSSGNDFKIPSGSKNVPNHSNNGKPDGDRRPTKEQASSDPDSDTSDQTGGQTTKNRPASYDPLSSRGQGGTVPSNDRPLPFKPSSSSDSDTSDQTGGQTTNYRPASYDSSSSRGQGETVPSSDRPLPFKPSSSSDSDSDTRDQTGGETTNYRPTSFNPLSSNGKGGRGPSEDRPLSVKPSFSDRPSSNKFGPNAFPYPPYPQDGSSAGASEEATDFPMSVSPVAEDDTGSTPKRRMSQDSNLFAGVINDFAFKLVDRLKLDKNFVLSPLGIFMALSMIYLGSDGVTKSELENVLGLNANAIHGMYLHQGIKDLVSQILPTSREYDLEIANGMFLHHNFTLNVDFVENIHRFYSAELKNLDFENPALSLAEINEWVKRATKDMILSLSDLPPPALTRLLLVSAMYFEGIWKTQFPENMTYEGRFISSDGNTRLVPTMPLYGESFPFLRSDRHRHSFIKLPYEGDSVSMILALPYTHREKPMPAVSDRILCDVREAMVSRHMDTVALPKFRLEYSKTLRQPLGRMGLSSLFNPNTKNLAKMRWANDIYVSAFLHKAVIEVNERGTKASATTAVRFVPLSLRNTTDFVANHPFAFYVVHEPTGLVLFYGKIYSLAGKGDFVPDNRRQTVRDRPSRRNRTQEHNSRVRLHGAVLYEEGNK